MQSYAICAALRHFLLQQRTVYSGTFVNTLQLDCVCVSNVEYIFFSSKVLREQSENADVKTCKVFVSSRFTVRDIFVYTVFKGLVHGYLLTMANSVHIFNMVSLLSLSLQRSFYFWCMH